MTTPFVHGPTADLFRQIAGKIVPENPGLGAKLATLADGPLSWGEYQEGLKLLKDNNYRDLRSQLLSAQAHASEEVAPASERIKHCTVAEAKMPLNEKLQQVTSDMQNAEGHLTSATEKSDAAAAASQRSSELLDKLDAAGAFEPKRTARKSTAQEKVVKAKNRPTTERAVEEKQGPRVPVTEQKAQLKADAEELKRIKADPHHTGAQLLDAEKKYDEHFKAYLNNPQRHFDVLEKAKAEGEAEKRAAGKTPFARFMDKVVDAGNEIFGKPVDVAVARAVARDPAVQAAQKKLAEAEEAKHSMRSPEKSKRAIADAEAALARVKAEAETKAKAAS